MKILEKCYSAIPLKYVRFSATTGVHEIKLDNYRKLDDVRGKTISYIQNINPENNEAGNISSDQTDFDICARHLAETYISRRNLNS